LQYYDVLLLFIGGTKKPRRARLKIVTPDPSTVESTSSRID
jgi:hypothetical protein